MENEGLENEVQQEEEVKHSNGLKIFLLVAILALIVLAGICAVFFLIKPGSVGIYNKTLAYPTFKDVDGNIYNLVKAGEVGKVSADADNAISTRNQEKLVFLTEEKELYFTDKFGENKKEIATNVESIKYIRNSGVLYMVKPEKVETDVDIILENMAKDSNNTKYTYSYLKDIYEYVYKDNSSYKDNVEAVKAMYNLYSDKSGSYDEIYSPSTLYRYTFKDENIFEIGKANVLAADDSLNLMYIEENIVYFLSEDSTDKMKLKGINGKDSDLIYVSDDKNVAVWADIDGDTHSIYVSDNDNVEKIGEFEIDDTYSYYYAHYLKGNNMLLIQNSSSDYVLCKVFDGEAQKLRAGGEIEGLFTAKETLNSDISYKVDGIYALTVKETDDSSEQVYDLYYVTLDGEREKVVSSCKRAMVQHEYLYYIDENDNLRCGKIKDAIIEDEQKITSNVDAFLNSIDGKSTLIIKNSTYDSKKGSRYDIYASYAKAEPVKIAEECYPITIGSDGKTILYLKDRTEVSEKSYSYKGEFYKYTPEEGEVKIASDVIYPIRVNSYGDIDTNNMVFYQYDRIKKNEENSTEDVIANLVHYNGKETNVLVRDILY